MYQGKGCRYDGAGQWDRDPSHLPYTGSDGGSTYSIMDQVPFKYVEYQHPTTMRLDDEEDDLVRQQRHCSEFLYHDADGTLLRYAGTELLPSSAFCMPGPHGR